MRKLKFSLMCMSCLLISTTFAQKKELAEEASYYLEIKDYKNAYALYDKLHTKFPTNLDYEFSLGYSAIHYPEKKARAIEIFEKLMKTDKSPDVNYYLAKAYHVNYRFTDAINFYNEYLAAKAKNKNGDDKPLIEDAKLGIVNCNNGNYFLEKKINADIRNVGSPINTDEIEGVPIITADESILMYTYVGKKSTGGKLDDELKPSKDGDFHEDIFISTHIDDSIWTAPVGVSGLNTKGNDAAVAISPDGQLLFSFISNKDVAGDLYYSTLKGSEWSKPEKLNKNINSDEWEGSCSISSDGKYLYFASERPGGLGGRDLYVSEKINGDWGPAKNLGPKINTELNEDAPFIHADGITLFFSSEGHRSIGGYDIMYSIKQENAWIEPFSMGIPLNTPEDDRYYVLSARSGKGYFSSNRGDMGGKGKQDIYSVSPGILGEKPVLALLKGVIYADNKAAEAKIDVIKKGTNEILGPFYANSKTGKFLMALAPGNGYKIKITVSTPGFDPIEENIDIEKLQKFVEIKRDFHLYTPDFASKRSEKTINSILDSLLALGINAETFNTDNAITAVVEANKDRIEPVKEVEVETAFSVVVDSTKLNTTNNKEPMKDETNTNGLVDNSTVNGSKSNSESTKNNFIEPLQDDSNNRMDNNAIAKSKNETKQEAAKSGNTNSTSNSVLTTCDGAAMPDFTALKGKSLNVSSNYQQLLKTGGSVCAQGLVFRIQIAAYRKPENYKYDHLKEFGEPKIVSYMDGITRFTQLEFNTLNEAEAARQKIITKGQKDAWITAFVKEQRYTLEELIMANFLGQAIN